jgi:hypothetical protein
MQPSHSAFDVVASRVFEFAVVRLQVTPGESAVLVLLLCSVTGLAVHDLLGRMSQKPTKPTKKVTLPNKAEWGKSTHRFSAILCLGFSVCSFSEGRDR